jgi:hypothetical protein
MVTIMMIIIIIIPVAPNITGKMPVIIGATGTILKSFAKQLSNIPGNHQIQWPQKTAPLRTGKIMWKMLM